MAPFHIFLAVLVARPPITWPVLCAVGLTLFAGQFLFQFFGIANGMPPGLASIVVQTQALFTILFAGVVLKDGWTSAASHVTMQYGQEAR